MEKANIVEDKEVAMKRTSQVCRHSGFTLIELLVVVVIILILSAMTFGLGSLVYRKVQVKRAYRDLLNIQIAIEAFYREYGHYPPAQHFGTQPLDWDKGSTTDRSDGKPVYVPATNRTYQAPGVGIEAYIFSRTGKKSLVGGDAIGYYPLPDAAEKWSSYLEKIPIADWSAGTQTQNVKGVGDVILNYDGFIIVDPWMDQSGPSGGSSRYIYNSPPPDYQSYQLGCNSPDGVFWIMQSGGTNTYEKK
jgi:prepilin-type N-terminal cleavage/methylation domain-containing protein